MTPEHKARRRNYITASDAAAVCGLDPYRSAYDVWLEKCGHVDRDVSSEAAELGSRLENAIIDTAADKLGMQVEDRQLWVTFGCLGATLDATLIGAGERVICEAKTTGLTNRFASTDQWGEPGTDEVPERVIVQVHTQMICSGLARAYVPVLIGGRGLVVYHILRNQTLCQAIGERLETFWRRHVEANVEPASMPSLDLIKVRQRVPAKAKEIDAELVRRYQEAKAAAKAATDAADDRMCELLTALDDCEIGRYDGANGTRYEVRYVSENAGDRLDVTRLKKEHAGLFAEYASPTTRRVLRVKEVK